MTPIRVAFPLPFESAAGGRGTADMLEVQGPAREQIDGLGIEFMVVIMTEAHPPVPEILEGDTGTAVTVIVCVMHVFEDGRFA